MKNTFEVIICAFGSGMIGFFANRLYTVMGSIFFTAGIILLVGSIFFNV